MQWTALVAAGLTVSTANAFLIPAPETFEDDTIKALPINFENVPSPDVLVQSLNVAEGAKVELACPGCPVRVGHHGKGDGSVKTKTDIPSHLELDFQIDHASEADRLTVNGFSLYPISDALHSTMMAKLVPDFKGKGHHRHHYKPEDSDDDVKEIRDVKEHKRHQKSEDYKVHKEHKEHKDHKDHEGHKSHRKPEPLGFQVQTQTFPESTEDHLQVVQLSLQIIEVGNVFVEDIPSVLIKLIKTPEGGLMIGNMEIAEVEISEKEAVENQPECTTFLCKWRAIVMQQLARIHSGKPCAGAHGRPGQVAGQHSGHHEHHGHHGQKADGSHESAMGHHGMHHRHRWSHLFKNIASHILLPIAVGIAAGITASVLGMVVGTAIVYVWRLFFRPASARRSRHGQSAHKAVQKEASASEEKAGLMTYSDEVDAPPAYVDDTKPTSTEDEA